MPPARLEGLTERELEIVALVAEGLTNDDIAALGQQWSLVQTAS